MVFKIISKDAKIKRIGFVSIFTFSSNLTHQHRTMIELGRWSSVPVFMGSNLTGAWMFVNIQNCLLAVGTNLFSTRVAKLTKPNRRTNLSIFCTSYYRELKLEATYEAGMHKMFNCKQTFLEILFKTISFYLKITSLIWDLG